MRVKRQPTSMLLAILYSECCMATTFEQLHADTAMLSGYVLVRCIKSQVVKAHGVVTFMCRTCITFYTVVAAS